MTHTVTLVADHHGFTGPKVQGHEYYVDAIIDVTDIDDVLTTTGDFVASANTFRRTSGTVISGLTVGNLVTIGSAASGANNIDSRITAIDGDLITFTTIGADGSNDEITLSKTNAVIPYSEFGLSSVSQVFILGQEDMDIHWTVELGTDGNSFKADNLVLRPRKRNSVSTAHPTNDCGTVRVRLLGQL